MVNAYADCLTVSPSCPVEATTYGYAPNLGASIFFCAFFFALMLAQIVMGIMWKTRSFMIFMGIATACQGAGQIGRIMMHSNAWSQSGFKLQICLLTLAPVFNAAAIYLTIKHITLNLDPSSSRIPPARYPVYFLSFDCIVLLLQGAGGGVAAGGKTSKLTDIGTDMMVAGLVVQVITLFVFACVVADYFWRLRKERGNWRIQGHKEVTRFRFFMAATVVSFVTVFVRCVYRIPELSGGWGNTLMRNEVEFLILDSTMIAIGSLIFTIFHPGYWFPQMRHDIKDGVGGTVSGAGTQAKEGHGSQDGDSVVKNEQGYTSA